MAEITKRRMSFCLVGRNYIYSIPSDPNTELIDALEGLARKKMMKFGNYRKWYFNNEYFILEVVKGKPEINGKFRRAVWEEGVKRFEEFLTDFYKATIRET